ncbi:hypothetical protein KUCAC02_021572, partial [Chaenocephalus aceratus]
QPALSLGITRRPAKLSSSLNLPHRVGPRPGTVEMGKHRGMRTEEAKGGGLKLANISVLRSVTSAGSVEPPLQSRGGCGERPLCFRMQNILDQNLDMATALLAGEKLKELILPGSSQGWGGDGHHPILLVTLVFTRNFAEESIYCYTPHNFTRDQALYARGYCWTELRDAKPGLESHLWPSLFEHKFLPYALLAFAGIMYIPALGWEFLASTRLTSELNFLLQEIDNCYHRAAEGRAPKIEKQIQSKGPGITERERREIIENAERRRRAPSRTCLRNI